MQDKKGDSTKANDTKTDTPAKGKVRLYTHPDYTSIGSAAGSATIVDGHFDVDEDAKDAWLATPGVSEQPIAAEAARLPGTQPVTDADPMAAAKAAGPGIEQSIGTPANVGNNAASTTS